MKIKKLILFVLAAIIIFTLAACTTNAPVEDGSDIEEDNPIVEPAPEDETTTLKLYFASNEYIMSGNENLDSVLQVEREVELGEKSVEEVILEELKKDPKDEELATLLGEINVLSVKTKGNIAYVDLSSESLNGGSMEESLILDQIVLSLTELEEVDAVQILVDGSNSETLMGHISIDKPLKRGDTE